MGLFLICYKDKVFTPLTPYIQFIERVSVSSDPNLSLPV